MSKNKSQSTVTTTSTSLYLSLICLFPVMFLISYLIFYMIDTMLLKLDVSFVDSFFNHKRDGAITGICMWALCFYYVAFGLKINRPQQSNVIATARWRTLKEQKKYFGEAPIDTTQHLDVGGAPVHMISDKTLLYETDSFHDYCVGTTGSGKSRKIVRQLVMLASMASESMIFHDPKKEMYNDFHLYLSKKGYKVHVIDFRNPEYSDHWNPLDDITDWAVKDPDEADEYAQDQVESIVDGNSNSEPIWIDGQKALIISSLLEVASAPIARAKKNYYSLVQMISLLGKTKRIDGEEKMVLSAYMESLDETSVSRLSFATIATAPDKTRGSFITSSLASIRPFTSRKLMKVMSKSDFNFRSFKDGKHALFIVDPDEKKRYNPITAMMIESAYKTLVYEANQRDDCKLEKRVHFILDEFGNMAKIPNFDGKMTVARSRNILFHLYLQDYEQMNEKYGDHIAHIIRSNCNLWYFISSADHDVCKSISDNIGEEDIMVESYSNNFNNNVTSTGSGVNIGHQKKPLITPDELQNMDVSDGNGIIVYRSKLGPCKVYLPDCSQYSWYKEMENEIVRVRKDGFELEYAIPRYIVLSPTILASAGIKLRLNDSSRVSPRGVGKEEPLLSKNMYWYWSSRDDLEKSVFSHVIEYLKKIDLLESKISVQTLIRNYMKSDEFIEWLHSIDTNASDKDLDEVKRNLDEIEITDNDNAFSDAWS